MNTYRLADAPRGSTFTSWDCHFCDHQDLARPVFLVGPAGLVAAGSGCASVALYGHTGRARSLASAADLAIAQATRRAAEEADLAAERVARYTAALAEFASGSDAWSDVLVSCQRAYISHGAYAGTGLLFPDFLAVVAEGGRFPGPPVMNR